MIKNIFFFLGIVFCACLIAQKTYACDPLGCLIGGQKQDVLILGEVISKVENEGDIKVLFVFPQNKINFLKEGDHIKVTDLIRAPSLTYPKSETITVGKKYLMSLNTSDNLYSAAWGMYEVTGTHYSNVQLVENNSIDDEALQIFINSGGTQTDFSFDYSGLEPTLIRGGVRQESAIKQNIFRYSAGIGFFVLLGGIVFIARKKINI